VSKPDESLFDENLFSDDHSGINGEIDSLFAEAGDADDVSSVFTEDTIFEEPVVEVVADGPSINDLNDFSATAPVVSQAAIDVSSPGKKKKEKVKKEKVVREKQKKEKVAREKTPRIPRETSPMSKGFLGLIGSLLAIFLLVNVYVVLTNGTGFSVIVFLAVLDLFALGVLAVPFLFLLTNTKNPSVYDVALGVAVIAMLLGCMFFLGQIGKYGGPVLRSDSIKKASNDLPIRAAHDLKWQNV